MLMNRDRALVPQSHVFTPGRALLSDLGLFAFLTKSLFPIKLFHVHAEYLDEVLVAQGDVLGLLRAQNEDTKFSRLPF